MPSKRSPQHPSYPPLFPARRPALAGVGAAALLGIAALGGGCGTGAFEPGDELSSFRQPSTSQEATDAGPPPQPVQPKDAGTEPDPSEFFAGGAPGPDWPWDSGQ